MRREPQNLLQDGTGDKPADVLFGSFYHGRDLCVDLTRIDIHKKIRDPDSFLQSAVTHKLQIDAEQQGIICGLCVRSEAVLKRIFLKDRIFLTRLHKPGSISAFRSRSKGPMLIPYHFNRLLPLVVADSASFF
jgi:hypothetical protein